MLGFKCPKIIEIHSFKKCIYDLRKCKKDVTKYKHFSKINAYY